MAAVFSVELRIEKLEHKELFGTVTTVGSLGEMHVFVLYLPLDEVQGLSAEPQG